MSIFDFLFFVFTYFLDDDVWRFPAMVRVTWLVCEWTAAMRIAKTEISMIAPK